MDLNVIGSDLIRKKVCLEVVRYRLDETLGRLVYARIWLDKNLGDENKLGSEENLDTEHKINSIQDLDIEHKLDSVRQKLYSSSINSAWLDRKFPGSIVSGLYLLLLVYTEIEFDAF